MNKNILLCVTTLIISSGVFLGCGNGLKNQPDTIAPVSGGNGSDTNEEETPTVPKKMFIILQDLDGDLKTFGAGTNGINGADKACQNDSQSSGGTYKALMVDGLHRIACTTANCSGGTNEHLDWVLKPNTEYRQIDGTTVIGKTNAKGIFDFPLQDIFSTSAYFLWTGIQSDWTADTNNCSRFESTAGNARTGSSNATDGTAISWNLTACNYYGTTILCVEQ